jgi:hypothetical protein
MSGERWIGLCNGYLSTIYLLKYPTQPNPPSSTLTLLSRSVASFLIQSVLLRSVRQVLVTANVVSSSL